MVLYLECGAGVSIRPRIVMKKNVIKLLGIAFAVALLSTFLFYRLLVGKLASGGVDAASVVVAARRIEPGAILSGADLKMAAVPESAGARGGFYAREQLIGMMALEAIEANEMIASSRVAPRDSKAAAGARVPAGMRAVTIHVADSSGVVAILRPGHRIDIHAVANQGGGASLRTLLQNVEVLSASPNEGIQNRNGYQDVTVLVTPEQAELLALADSGSRIRIALRNTADPAQQPTRRLAISQIFDGAAARRAPAEPAGRTQAAAAAPQEADRAGVTLLVRMLSAAPGVLDELRADLLTPPEKRTLQVSAFRPGSDFEQRLNRLSAKRLVEVLSASRLVAAANREVSVQAGAEWPAREGAASKSACGLRIQLSPAVSRRGTIRLRLEPELRSLAVDGVASRRTETEIELADRQSCLVTGLLDSGSAGAVLDRLFPGRIRPEANQEFLVVVTPRLAGGVETAALRAPR